MYSHASHDHLAAVVLCIFTISCTSIAGDQLADDQEAFIDPTKLIPVQKCCPEDEMMVQAVQQGNRAPTIACRKPNATFSWAPDLAGDGGQTWPFKLADDGNATRQQSAGDSPSSQLCTETADGACILATVAKPECGPVTFRKRQKCIRNATDFYLLSIVSCR